jgi:hypothetical protein
MSGGVGLIGAAATGALGAAVLGGAAARKALSVDESLAQLMIKGRKPGQFVDPGSFAKQKRNYGRAVSQAAVRQGIDPMVLMDAVKAYIGQTGNVGDAIGHAGTFAKFIGTGTAGGDIGKTAAFASMKFGERGKVGRERMSKTEMDEALSIMYVSGKRNQFELPDFARQGPKMMSAMKRFNPGLTGTAAVQQMATWGQLAMRGTGKGAQAGTAFESFIDDIIKKSHKVGDGPKGKGLGVRMREGPDGTGKLRNWQDILVDVLTASGGEIMGSKGGALGLADIFNKRGIRGMSAPAEMFQAFMNEDSQKGNTEAEKVQYARQRMIETLAEMAISTDAVSESNADAAHASETTTAKFQRAWNRIVDVATETLLPMLEKFSDALPALIPAIKALFEAMSMLGSGIIAILKLIPNFGFDSPENLQAQANYEAFSADARIGAIDIMRGRKVDSKGVETFEPTEAWNKLSGVEKNDKIAYRARLAAKRDKARATAARYGRDIEIKDMPGATQMSDENWVVPVGGDSTWFVDPDTGIQYRKTAGAGDFGVGAGTMSEWEKAPTGKRPPLYPPGGKYTFGRKPEPAGSPKGISGPPMDIMGPAMFDIGTSSNEMGPPMYDPFGLNAQYGPQSLVMGPQADFMGPPMPTPSAAGGGSDTAAKNGQAANTNLIAAEKMVGAAEKMEKGAGKAPPSAYGGGRP